MTIVVGDCREVLAGCEPETFHAVVTDPPYELNFMGRGWDNAGVSFDPETWRAVYRVLKPGGHLLAFSGTRTSHRMVGAIEDAGFEIRDSIVWLTGQGFPKSLDVGKAIDKAAGVTREVVGSKLGQPGYSLADNGFVNKIYGDLHDPPGECVITVPATDAAREWAGWGTALKPSHEPICMARKPFRGTVAASVMAHGTGALNIAASRIGTPESKRAAGSRRYTPSQFAGREPGDGGERLQLAPHDGRGRWPPNVAMDEDAARLLDEMSGERPSRAGATKGLQHSGRHGGIADVGPNIKQGTDTDRGYGSDTGGASRFFFVAGQSLADEYCWLCDGPKHSIMSATKEGAQWSNGASSAAKTSGPTDEGSGSAPNPARVPSRPDDAGKSQSNGSPAHSAAPSSMSTPATIGSIALAPAQTLPDDPFVLRVQSAGNLCASCATAIALSLAPTQPGHVPASPLGKGSMPEHRRQTLIRCLVFYAETRESIATTPTTASLKMWFGFVRDAMSQPIPENATEDGFVPKRFRYQSKASRAERNAGLDGMPERINPKFGHGNNEPDAFTASHQPSMANHHPTVKPVALMRWLVRMVTPPGGHVLDPFMGSGSTGVAAALEGFAFTGIEQDAEYAEIARRRIAHAGSQPALFREEVTA